MNIHEQIANIKAGIVREPSKDVRQLMQRQLRNLEYKLSKEGVSK